MNLLTAARSGRSLALKLEAKAQALQKNDGNLLVDQDDREGFVKAVIDDWVYTARFAEDGSTLSYTAQTLEMNASEAGDSCNEASQTESIRTSTNGAKEYSTTRLDHDADGPYVGRQHEHTTLDKDAEVTEYDQGQRMSFILADTQYNLSRADLANIRA